MEKNKWYRVDKGVYNAVSLWLLRLTRITDSLIEGMVV